MFLNVLTSDTKKMSRYCHTSYKRRKPCKAHSVCITKLIRSRLGTRVCSIECLDRKIFFGILDLTMGCLIRLCHDVNDDVAIFTKLSLVFPCGNKKPQANFNPRKQHYFHLQNKHLNFLTLTFFAI